MFKKILFCTDFSENSHYAFSYALNLAKTYKGELLILHITPSPWKSTVPRNSWKTWCGNTTRRWSMRKSRPITSTR